MGIRASSAVLVGLLLHAVSPGVVRAQSATPAAAADSAATLTPPAVAPASTPPDFPRGRISGYMFGDAYYNVDGDPTHVYSASGADAGQTNVDGVKNITKDLNGAQFRRIYFQLDNDLSVRLATRFRLEVDGRSTTTADGRLGVFVKNAYLQAKSVIPRGDLFFGMLSTPTFENSEEFWQYRSIEKTICDFRGIASSSDLGVELKGFVDGGHHVGYSAMVGDGTGQRPESDRFKRFYVSLPLRFGDLRLEPYADYQPVRVTPNLAAPAEPESVAVANDQATWKIFAGYELKRVALGVEAFDRVLHRAGVNNVEPRGFSVFARGIVTPMLNLYARADLFQPDVNAANRVDTWLYIAGLDWTPFRDGAWQPLKDVHVMPNVEAVRYEAKGTAVAPAHGDLQARLTLFYRFSRPQS